MCLADILRNPENSRERGQRYGTSTIPYRDVAGWRSDFFACLIYQTASSLRTESNTAN
jgi:hypothetical protein